MRIAVLTDTDKPRYFVIEVTEEQFTAYQEDYADQAYQRYKQELAERHKQKEKSEEENHESRL